MSRYPNVPIEPLLVALDDRRIPVREACRRAATPFVDFHVDKRRGSITVWKADRVAVSALNLHPVLIWGDCWLDEDAMNIDVERANRIDLAFAQMREVAS